MEVKMTIAHAGGDLRLVERTAEAITRPRALSAVGEYRSRTLGDACQNGFKAVVQRHYGFTPVLALASRNHDCVGTDMRPRQAQQIAEPQAGMRCKVYGVSDLRVASLLDAGDVGFGPDDLGSVAAVELLDALARVAG